MSNAASTASQIRVGIITMPHGRRIEAGTNHIMKSYVDWFQVRGVNVVAIPYDTPRPEWYFNRVDGVLIQGGGAKMNPYLYQTCLTFIRHSIDLWKTGRRLFPIWGTCLGFEIIVSLVGHVFPLQQFNALNYMKKLTLTKEAAAADGRLYRSAGFTPEYRRLLESAPIVEFNHSHGISPQKFRGNVVLHRAFSVTSTAVDRDGRTFVASIEGRGGLPIYGVKGHPERQPVTNAPFLDFFVGELRRAHERRGGGDAGGGGLLPLTGVRPKVVVGKCAQYTEHRLQNCFFFKDGSDGGRLGVDRISRLVKELLEDTSAAAAAGVRDE